MVDDLLQEMIDPTPQRTDVSRWRRFGATVAIFALAGVGITSLTTNALFTDRETTAGDLLTGTVDLSLGGFSFTMPNGGMAPGDVVVQPITVNNTGSLALRYAVSFLATRGVSPSPDPTNNAGTGAVGTGDLRTVLGLDVFHVADAAGCTTTTPVPPDAGSQHGLAVTAYTPILGDPAVGPQPGDSEILGGGTGSQTLCVRLSMDPASTNDYQNTFANVSLRFDAEQVVNNTATPTP
jgi:hypothetical protein